MMAQTELRFEFHPDWLHIIQPVITVLCLFLLTRNSYQMVSLGYSQFFVFFVFFFSDFCLFGITHLCVSQMLSLNWKKILFENQGIMYIKRDWNRKSSLFCSQHALLSCMFISLKRMPKFNTYMTEANPTNVISMNSLTFENVNSLPCHLIFLWL